MLKSNARAIWLFSNLCEPEIKREEILIRRGTKDLRFLTKTKKTERARNRESPNRDNRGGDGKVGREVAYQQN